MSEDLKETLDYDYIATHVESRNDIPSEIQHPTDLLCIKQYNNVAYLLVRLGVLPLDINWMDSKFWADYEV